MNVARTRTVPPMTDFDLRSFRLFRAVVQSGGFSAAESVLGISRSAISQQMSDFEARLGLRLCQRGRAGFALTDEGREVYRAVEHVLSVLEGFRAEVDSLHKSLRGELHIGLVDNLVTAPQMRITHALARLKRRGDAVRIQIRMQSPTEIEQGVLDGRLHIGVVHRNNLLSGLEYRPLYDETACLYCASGHPLFDAADDAITDAQIDACDAIAPSFRLPPEILRLYRALRCTASATDREGMAFLILTGQYIGYLPEHYARQWVQAGSLRAIHPQSRRYALPLVAITRKGRRPHLVLETFLGELYGDAAAEVDTAEDSPPL